MPEINFTKFLGAPSLTSEAPLDFMKGDLAFNHYVLTPSQRSYLAARGIALDKGLIVPKQVHGDAIWGVTSQDLERSGVYEADAIVTQEAGLAIGIRTADCLPAFLHDPVRGVIAVVHAGWKSTRLDIAYKTVEFLRRHFQAEPGNIRVAVGPCIRRDSCEVGPEFKEYFPKETSVTQDGLRFDIFAANLRQLAAAGVKRDNIFDSGLCSYKDPVRFHSFRRDAEGAGRMLSVMVRP